MECEKSPLLKHLAVHEPEALSAESWKNHLDQCSSCLAEWRSYTVSLAVYRHVERESAARYCIQPSWDAYQRRLQEQRSNRRQAFLMTGAWLAGMVGLVLFGGAMSWGLWYDNEAYTGTEFVLDEAALRSIDLGAPGAIPPVSRAVRSSVAAAAGSYGLTSQELRALRRWKLLEFHAYPVGRPSGEVAMIPFSHANGAPPYIMPVTSAPASGILVSYPTASPFQGAYSIASPIR